MSKISSYSPFPSWLDQPVEVETVWRCTENDALIDQIYSASCSHNSHPASVEEYSTAGRVLATDTINVPESAVENYEIELVELETGGQFIMLSPSWGEGIRNNLYTNFFRPDQPEFNEYFAVLTRPANPTRTDRVAPARRGERRGARRDR